MSDYFLEKRIPLGISSLIVRIGSILSRLEREKDCGSSSFQDVFQRLGQLFGSIADMMLLNDGRCLEDALLQRLFRFQYADELFNYRLYELSCGALRVEDTIEMISTVIDLHQQDQKREAAASSRRSISFSLRLPFSKGRRYRRTLDRLRSELNRILRHLQTLFGSRHSYIDEYLGFLERATDSVVQQQSRAGFPLCARGMDSDLDKEVLTSESNPREVMIQTFPFERPVVDVAETWPRYEDLKAIVMRLLSQDHSKNDKVPVLPIVGVPGVGKTTLAWLLYCSDQVCTHFRRKLWLDVSNGFDLDPIAQAVEAIAIKLRWMPDQQEVEQGDDNPIITAENDARPSTLMKIFGRIRNVKHQHRYLIIVDGLKYEDRHNWLVFRESLKGTGSHVIITTRHKRAISEDSAAFYVLQGLPELYSWQYLLDDKLHSQCHTLPKPLPSYIARAVHCSAGVPLALNILRRRMDTDPRYLNSNEIVILKVSPSSADDMFRDLLVNLPEHLRTCFAYCSLFPSGYEIDKSTLIQLWMAQGFIPTQSDSDAEESGDECFRELLDRSLLSEMHKDEFGNIRSCRMHKLMHDLSLIIDSRIINKDWVSMYSRYLEPDGSYLFNEVYHGLHVSYEYHYGWLDNIIDAWEDQRTLLLLDQGEFAYSSLSHPSLEERLQKKLRLRVLDLHKVNIKRVPTSIIEMKLLRYLDLSENPNLIMLPDSITQLIHLQTLKLSHCEKLKELPKDIARLENLRHLEIVGCLGLTHMPSGIGQLTALRTLSMFVVGEESGTSLSVGELSELKALNHLRGKLELRHLEKPSSSSLGSSDLEKKEHLESVALVWETGYAEDADGSTGNDERTLEGLQLHHNLKGFSIHGYRGVNFPKWLSTLSNLIKITVKDCHSCRSLPPLHRLPRLQYLILENMDSLEYIIPDNSATALEGSNENSTIEGSSNDAISFPSLIHLCLKELPNLKGWLNVNDATSNPNQILVHSFPAIEDLHVCRVSKKQLENLLLQFPNSSLMSLCISCVKDLDSLPKILSSNLSSIKNLEMRYCPNLLCLPTFLVSLKSLSVVGCDSLTSLPWDIQHLQALEKLKLKYCFELDLQKSHNHVKPHNDIDLKWWPQFDLVHGDHCGYLQVGEDQDSSYFAGLKNLSYLEIKCLPKLVSLPDGICELPSLQQLCLSCCDSLKYLPERMQQIPNLYKIKINGCPLLKERCCDKTSREWERICHIWDRDLDWDKDQISIETRRNPYQGFLVGE